MSAHGGRLSGRTFTDKSAFSPPNQAFVAMSDIRSTAFWTDLLKKILRIILKNAGLGGSRRRSRNQHVVPHPDGGWAVKGESNDRYTAVFEYQDEAIERARQIAINYGADVIIHRRDGSIRDRRSYRKGTR